MADTAIKLPSLNVLDILIRKGNTTRDKVGTLNGDYGEAIADAVDKHNLHASAFKLAAKLKRMDPVKLNAFLTHFDDYRGKLGIDALAAPDLPGVEPEPAAEPEPEPEGALH